MWVIVKRERGRLRGRQGDRGGGSSGGTGGGGQGRRYRSLITYYCIGDP